MTQKVRKGVSNGSERQKGGVAPNVETNDMQWLWTPNEAKHGFERRNEWRNGSERRMRIRLWTSNWEVVMMALNVKTENTTRIALNTDTDEWWLWTPNEDVMAALDAEIGNVMRMTLNTDTEKW